MLRKTQELIEALEALVAEERWDALSTAEIVGALMLVTHWYQANLYAAAEEEP